MTDTCAEPARRHGVLESGDVLYVPSHSPYVGDYGGNRSLDVSVTFRRPAWRNLATAARIVNVLPGVATPLDRVRRGCIA